MWLCIFSYRQFEDSFENAVEKSRWVWYWGWPPPWMYLILRSSRISGGWFTKQTLDDTSSSDKYTIKARTNTHGGQIHKLKYTVNKTTEKYTWCLFTVVLLFHLILSRYNNQVLNKQDGCEEDEWWKPNWQVEQKAWQEKVDYAVQSARG